MPSTLSKLNAIFPGLRLAPTPPPGAVVASAQKQLANSTRRGRPSTAERVPANYHGGIAGKVWFLPFADSATHDSPEIRAAMRLMPRSPHVKAGWWTQILSVMCQDWQFHPGEKGNPESEEQCKAFETCVREYTAGGPPEVARAICSPFGPDGYTLAEKVWGYGERGRLAGKYVLEAVKPKDSCDVDAVGDRFNNVTAVRARRAAGQEFPVSDFVYARYLPMYDEPLGTAAFRASYAAYWMLDTVEKLRAIHVEKRMGGMLMGTYADDADKPGLETAMSKAKTATWISVPDGCKVEAIQLSTASEPDFKSFVESKQSDIVLGLSGATLQILQGTVPDARADTKVQKQMSDLFPWLLTYLMLQAVNRQVAPDFVDYNYPYAAGGYPTATLGAVANSELSELLDLILKAQSAGFNDLDKNYYGASLSLQRADPKKPEDKLTPAAPQGPAGGIPAGGGALPFGEKGGPAASGATFPPGYCDPADLLGP